MPAKVNADYSKFPKAIRDVMPYVEGETHELRNHWQIHYSLFMEDKRMTQFYAERFGPLLGVFQNLITKEMVLSICRLTDKDNRSQRNLSVWSLKDAIPFAKSKDFAGKVNSALAEISKLVANSRLRRHKEIAHFDLDVSLGNQPMPKVLFREIKVILERLEDFLNLFQREFAQTTVGYDSLSSGEFIEIAIETAVKAEIYDEVEAEKIISFGEMERRLAKWPWWKWPA